MIIILFASCSKRKDITFYVCTDVHADIIHDESDRIKTFIEAANENGSDFIIELGDFCFPEPQNNEFLESWNSFKGKKYHVLGNHDLDVNCKDRYIDFTGMIHNFYSFDIDDYHFIVLDANYFESDSGFIDYEYGNYYASGEKRCNIPPEQIEWLKKDLSRGDTPTIVFSHQGLLDKGGIRNKVEVRQILENSGRVIAAFSGHAHSDHHQHINGIDYIILNSMSDIWVGEKYMSEERFSNEINEANPSLKYTIPFKDPLFAKVTIKKGTIIIEGTDSEFIPPGPHDLGIEGELYGLPVSASISSRELRY